MIFLRITLAALTLGVFIGSLFLPPIATLVLSSEQAETFSQNVEPEPLEIYCPGGAVLQGGDAGTDIGSFELVAAAELAVANESEPGSLPESIESGILITSPDLTADQSTLLLTGNQILEASEKRMAGLSSLNCAQPANQGIFITGNNSVGTESLLIVSNPQEVETVVDLEVFGLEQLTTQKLILAAGEQKYLSLSGLAGDASAYGLRFRSSGGPVSVVMQQRTISGLQPTGIETSDWLTEPIATGAFPIVKVLGSQLSPEADLTQPTLRVYNPAQNPAQVAVSLFSSSSSKEVNLTVQPNQFLDTQLDLSDGNWSATFESDTEVFAAVRNPVFGQAADYEWLYPANEIENALRIPLSRPGELHLVNPSTEGITYQIEGYGQIQLGANQRRTLAISAEEVSVAGKQIWTAVSFTTSVGYAVTEPKENRNFGADLQVVIH
jgi:hypothetical protein